MFIEHLLCAKTFKSVFISFLPYLGSVVNRIFFPFHGGRADNNSKQLRSANCMPGTVLSALGFISGHTQNSPVGEVPFFYFAVKETEALEGFSIVEGGLKLKCSSLPITLPP